MTALAKNIDSRRGSRFADADQAQRLASEINLSRSTSKMDLQEIDFPIHDIPGSRNFAFVGREDVLTEMHDFFTSNKESRTKGPTCFVLHGLAGQGKSQIALEYAYEHTADYDVIFWLEAEEEQELARSYSLISKKLRLPNSGPLDEGQDPTKGVQDTQRWFEKAVGKFPRSTIIDC